MFLSAIAFLVNELKKRYKIEIVALGSIFTEFVEKDGVFINRIIHGHIKQ